MVIYPFYFHRAVHLFTVQVYIYILPYISYLHYFNSVNLSLSLKTSMNNPGRFAFPPADSTAPVPIMSGAVSRKRSTSFSYAVSTDLYQPGPPKPLSSSISTESPSSNSFVPPLRCGQYPRIHTHHKHSFPAAKTIPPSLGFGPHIIPRKYFSFSTTLDQTHYGSNATHTNPIGFVPHFVSQRPPPRCKCKAKILCAKKALEDSFPADIPFHNDLPS